MKLSIVYKIGLLAALLVTLTTGVVIAVFYTNINQQLVQHTLEDLVEKVGNQGRWIQTHIESQRKDVLVLSNTPPIQGILRSRQADGQDVIGGSNLEQWKSRFFEIFKALVKVNPDYLQVRLIDTNGQELLSIFNSSSGLFVVPDSELQNKISRKYVTETLKLATGIAYISEINLNKENGVVVKPHQQVLRTATPVFDNNSGRLNGIVVLNSEIGHQLHRMQEEIQLSGREIYITNDHGGYLLHPDPSRTYGFDLGYQYRAQEDVPKLAKLYLPGNKDKQLILLPEETDSLSATVYTKIPFDIDKPERYFAVGITQSYETIVAADTAVLRETLGWTVIIVFVGIVLTLLFSMRLIRPLKSIALAMDDFSHQRQSTIDLPVNQHDEIGLLARTYQQMFNQVEQSQADLKESNKGLERRIEIRTQSLQDSELRQRTVVETMADGLITMNNKGVIQSFNNAAEKIFGYGAEEVLQKNIKMLMTAADSSQHDNYLNKYEETGNASIIGIGRELEGQRKDGHIFPIELAVSEMLLGGKVFYTGAIRDISERKQMDKIKNEFISTVSHELRTPLTSIRGSLGLVNAGAVGEIPEQAKQMLTIAGNNTERLLLLINDILDVQKIESGELTFKFNRVDVMSLLEMAVLNNAAYAQEYDVAFNIIKKIDGVSIYADADRIIQVITNLLSNAAKFSPRGEAVEISVSRCHDDLIRISVTDYGAGIPKDFQPRLFDKFTQSDSSDSRQKGGTGLGLSISKAIVEKHGGYISYVTQENIGTTMFFELLEIKESTNSNDYYPRKINSDVSPSILIVEDDVDIAALLQRMFAEAGYNSDVAYSADQARQLLKKKYAAYRAITLDILLPDEDGIQLIKSIQDDSAVAKIPIVVVSAEAIESRRSLKGGAINVLDWIQKPFDQDKLIRTIKRVVNSNNKAKILHVEDEEDVHAVVRNIIADQCDLSWSNTLVSSRKILENEVFDLVLLDIGLPDGSGLDLLEIIQRRVSPPRVIIFSATDVSEKYADQVAAVLVKSNVTNRHLAEVISNVIQVS